MTGLTKSIDGKSYGLFREASTKSEVESIKRLINKQEGNVSIRVLKNVTFSFRGKLAKSKYGVYFRRI